MSKTEISTYVFDTHKKSFLYFLIFLISVPDQIYLNFF